MKMTGLFLSILYIAGCGVKGLPQPPLDPPLISRGRPSYNKATEEIKVQQKTKKKIEGDFDEPEDFAPSEGKK